GYTGVGTKTVLPSKAHAKFTFRLVGKQNPEKVLKAFQKFVKDLIPKGDRVAVKDPRFCFTLGPWVQQLSEHDVRLIYAARGEPETVESWHRAYGIPMDKALGLIRARQKALQEWIDLCRIPHTVVLYENWFENPCYNALKISHVIDFELLPAHVLGVVKDRTNNSQK
ncbi:MAG TPA: peptidase dimerization domain-containing protein, partial [bacterium]|nr:peptidase dimerization domain-containing protein [bacterium]